jgi:hypothetical protein
LHIGIEDLPLGGLNREDGGLGWGSLDTSLLEDDDWGLGGTLLIVEHVSEGSLLVILTIVGHLSRVLLDGLVDVVQELGVSGLLLLKELLLVSGFLRLLEQDVTFDGVMEHNLIHNVLGLEYALFP